MGRKFVALLAAGTAILANLGCSAPTYDKVQVSLPTSSDGGQGQLATGANAEADRSIPKNLRRYYRQAIDWSTCDGSFECGSITVPLDWADPGTAQVSIALKKLPAARKAQGSLLINPGGPGESGTEFVTHVKRIFGQDTLNAYDVIGFDPRGTGLSSGIRCYSDERWDARLAQSFPFTASGMDEARASSRMFAQACKAAVGDLLAHVDTQSVARDMDAIRSALGEKKLNYLGYSYGSLLGSTYAALFPGRAGRMVLDSAIDPRVDPAQMEIDQAAGFEAALKSYVAYCLEQSGCPLSGSVDDGLAQIATLLDDVSQSPLTGADDRQLTQSRALVGIIYPLYSRSLWPVLTSALGEAIRDRNGSQLLANSDSYESRNEDGSFDGTAGQAFVAISCLEPQTTLTLARGTEIADSIMRAAPTLGDAWVQRVWDCYDWPYSPIERDYDVSARGTGPIVVIGSTGDPATPYSWAQGLSEVLDGGILVTYEGEGHGAYGMSNDCVLGVVDDYLVSGTVPKDGTTC
ncbi:alpha/beta hydrolase family protein [Rarobacter incanus]|uniref:Alpha/beta hydrolase family protein n=1 Tax=Rarobacter incanus TaxID=153494 RepID=A0A542SP33_9MICO|nr:alpha/beta hydrolase family protein [Rarobacter incanus]